MLRRPPSPTARPGSRRTTVALLLCGLAGAALALPQGTSIVGAADPPAGDDLTTVRSALTGVASKFVPITPIRALDTRSDDGIVRVHPDSAFSLDPISGTGVAAAAGVSADDITAVVINTTMINVAGRGFGTTWPTGTERLTSATNNTEFPGHTIGNLAIAPVGLERKISFYASTAADVTVDVLGVFVESGPTDDGRFTPLGPTRHSDTRVDGTPYGAGEKRTIDLTTAGVPADASAVVLNVTAAQSVDRGFYRVWASGEPEPLHANVNVLEPGDIAGNQVVSGLTDGMVDISSSAGGELVIDVTGYFTGDGGSPSNEGVFVPFTPGRLLDTRRPGGPTGLTGGEKLATAQRFTLPVAGRLDVPSDGAMAVAINLTAAQTNGVGFVKAAPSGAVEPETSALNFTGAGQTVPNHAITTLDPASGDVDLFPSIGTHLIADASGYFLSASGTPPAGNGIDKVVDPGSFVPAPLVGPAPTLEPYDFLFDRSAAQNTGSRPVPTRDTGWDNCQPIRYALNVDLAGDDEIAWMISSIEEVELHSGIDFQYAGVTSAGTNLDDTLLLPENQGLPFRFLPPGADAVIGFSNSDQTRDLGIPGVIGIGGGLRIPSSEEMFRGFAMIDLPAVDGEAEITATSTHELGHMVGLGHVSDFDERTGAPSTEWQGLAPGDWTSGLLKDQLMYPTLNPSNTTFDEGDARGLWELYANPSCSGSSTLTTKRASTVTDVPVDWGEVEIFAPLDDFGDD